MKQILFTGHRNREQNTFNIDLSNPIHFNMDMEQEHYPEKYFRKIDYDYINYA